MTINTTEDNLDERLRIRIFPDTRAAIEELMKEHPGRWDNISHFVRAATNNFINQVKREM